MCVKGKGWPAPERPASLGCGASPSRRGALGRGQRRADRLDGAGAALLAREGVEEDVDIRIDEGLREPFSRLIRMRKIGRALDDGLDDGPP